MVLTAYPLSPVNGLFATVAERDNRHDTSVEVPGPHVFAVRSYALVLAQLTSMHPRPAFVTIANAPFGWAGVAKMYE